MKSFILFLLFVFFVLQLESCRKKSNPKPNNPNDTTEVLITSFKVAGLNNGESLFIKQPENENPGEIIVDLSEKDTQGNALMPDITLSSTAKFVKQPVLLYEGPGYVGLFESVYQYELENKQNPTEKVVYNVKLIACRINQLNPIEKIEIFFNKPKAVCILTEDINVSSDILANGGIKSQTNSNNLYFKGTLDGKNKTLKVIGNIDQKKDLPVGLFYNLAGTIKNLKIIGNSIFDEINIKTVGSAVGILSIYLNAGQSLKIENLAVSGFNILLDGKENANAAGFIALSNSKLEIINSQFKGNITVQNGKNNKIAGLVASSNAEAIISIDKSYFDGELTNNRGQNTKMAGLLGSNQFGTISIKNSYAKAIFKPAEPILGTANYSTFIGGLIYEATGNFSIQDSYADARINQFIGNHVPKELSMGGIIGIIDASTKSYRLENTYVIGYTDKDEHIGGIIGNMNISMSEDFVKNNFFQELFSRKVRIKVQIENIDFLLKDVQYTKIALNPTNTQLNSFSSNIWNKTSAWPTLKDVGAKN